ncbi:iron-containing alcohol dehydrogenase [Hydrogenovibrio sp. 3SP14C1]|uniref:iron-containing alcohol dehydrogenase n=1 Tax=Hydrogenovibrio sp. 3SP14C1 TaxID=3038774 RepID=UPI002417D5A5|nr:iron-containing alcohol dehydrogenase [Hydrogenovibrio sp. 3SP14C1]MDG4813216.1 iron-containing alcohol dehydrogenase [Hydrogenovibrio sp. 3SP14C1]
MIADFQIANLPKIQFGWGIRDQFAQAIAEQGYQSVVLISGQFLTRPGGFSAELITQLQQKNIRVNVFVVSGEPSPDLVDEIVKASPNNAEAVIGIGGGSVLDAAKAVAGLIPSQTSVMDYLEGVGKGLKLTSKTLPFIAMPTTAGTGSETTKNAVLSRLDEFKKSFRDDKLLAKEVWLDPSFLPTCPHEVLYSTGMDAFTQLLESYTTLKANPITDALAWQGMTLFNGAFEAINSDDFEQQKTGYGNLMLAACLSGITLANAGLGAVHGLAGPIGAFFKAPHGVLCAALLAPITEANILALQQSDEAHAANTLVKYAQIGRLFTATSLRETDALSVLIEHLRQLTKTYIPNRLSEYGLQDDNLAPVLNSCRSGSMTGNPLILPDETLLSAIGQAL